MDTTVAAALIGVVGLLGGIGITEALAARREQHRDNSDRRRLAGALAAELRGLFLRWEQLAPKDTKQTFIAAWSADEDYFSVFDNAGSRLGLLPPELACDVVSCYIRAKASMDSLRVAARLGDLYVQGQLQTETRTWLSRTFGGAPASFSYAHAVKYANDLVKEGRANVLPRLDRVAEGRQLGRDAMQGTSQR